MPTTTTVGTCCCGVCAAYTCIVQWNDFTKTWAYLQSCPVALNPGTGDFRSCFCSPGLDGTTHGEIREVTCLGD